VSQLLDDQSGHNVLNTEKDDTPRQNKDALQTDQIVNHFVNHFTLACMEAVTVRPYAPRTLFMGCASILLSSCFAWIIVDAQPGADVSFAYFLGIVFGFPALLFVLMGLPGSTFVKADSKGVEVRFLWLRTYALSWAEIQGFEFECMSSSLLRSPYANVVRVMLTSRGGRPDNERGIPDVFSVRAVELARLLNDMRKWYAHAG
jgi:hypothetical protein